ncbi:hypothetical protein [Thioalkalivibrio sp. ALE20]|uniref:hypothetical protein n=1 Tax=Thioalkalivibrio sp. ALE20 TaxID=545275 RepID=UPI0012EAA277|nr:hypothetical protein [Thioalkalivibrio sp. ALE20]
MRFEDYSQYISNFSHLDRKLGNEKDISGYYSKWMAKYSSVFKNCKARTTIDWDVRTSKSLKEVFTSASFYKESQLAKDYNSWSAFYFLSYYSLFHALLANVYLLPEERLESLSEITHSKLINVFHATFSAAKPYVVNGKIKELFEVLRYAREYYSYHMPFNDFLYSHKEINRPDLRLPYFLRCCFQLASLHSEMIEKAFQKHGKVVRGAAQLHRYKKETFMRAHSRVHPLTGEYILDPSDEFRIRELIAASGPTSFVINLEHYCDEFRSYVGDRSESREHPQVSQQEIYSFVYNAIQ